MRNKKIIEQEIDFLHKNAINLSEKIIPKDFLNPSIYKKEQEIYEFAYGILNWVQGNDDISLKGLVEVQLKNIHKQGFKLE